MSLRPRVTAAVCISLLLLVACAPKSPASDPTTNPLRIASINLQVFGTSKAANPALFGVYARIIRHFDIVAVQEIRDASGTALPALMSAINADGSYFDEGSYLSVFPASTYDWPIENSVDSTEAVSSNTYDRVMTTKSAEEDYGGTAGVYRYDQSGDLGTSGLTSGQVSDHFPVYAESWVGKDPE